MTAPCSRCLEDFELLAEVGKLYLCPACWKKAGSPFPNYPATKEEEALHRQAVERGMLKRGGELANAVRKGKT